jgi:hypothetical protein
MTREQPAAANEKTVVCIRVSGDVPDLVVHCIGWGLEEEGIPAQTGGAQDHATAALLAKAASRESRLHVGIGIHGATGQVALHHRDMPDEKPLFIVPLRPFDQQALVRLGKNAARLVKGNPFRFADTPAPEPRETKEGTSVQDAFRQMVFGIVQAMLADAQERKIR